MKGVLSILAIGLCLSLAVAARAGAVAFRTGVVANDFGMPNDLPVRIIVQGAGAADGSQVSTAIADTQRLHAAGHLILARADWLMPDSGWQPWIDYAAAASYVVGNEVPPPDWDVFFQRFAHLAVLIHAAGKEVVLPAAATYDEADFLRAVPARLWSQIDAVGVHPYAVQDGIVRDVLQNLRPARALVPDGVPLFADEVGCGLARDLLYSQPAL